MWVKSVFVLFIFALSSPGALASKVSVELNDEDFTAAPAGDLVYQGQRIDQAQAMRLKREGVDLSLLNPRESNLWKDRKLSPINHEDLSYPASDQTLVFKEFKTSPSEIFRAVVLSEGKRFALTASLDNHSNILRAGILRLLGYDLDAPKFYKTLKVAFANKKEKEKFIELVGESTLTNRERWVKSRDDNNTLTLKGFTLEPAELRNVNIYLPVMSRTRQAERRVFRALLNLYVLTDFPQSANSIAWERGRQFNNSLIFNHPYASDFSSLTIDDMRWMHRRLSSLSREELRAAMEGTGLPQDLSALLLEKILSRLNHMGELLLMEGPNHPVDRLLSAGNVQNGKIVSDVYKDDYVVEFYKEDELSPYRFWELFRLFRTQTTYSGLSSLLDSAIERFVPGLRVDSALEDIQGQINDYRGDNPQLRGVMPVRAFVSPIANGRAFANRNVVFGQYLGSNAPIQLVDSAGAEVSLGVFSNITGLPEQILPSASALVSLGRTYTHVRAMPDLESATSQEIRKLLIPRHFKSLGKVILDEYSCAVPEEPYKEEADLNGETIYYVKYDPSWENARERAIAKRQELIDAGATETILLVTIDRGELCREEVSQTRKEHLEEFLKQFALNEMFIVSDTLRLGARLNAPIPLAASGSGSLNLNLTGESSVSVLRSVMVRKTETGMELTVQFQKDFKNTFSQGLSYFIELAANSTAWTNGKLLSKVYKIDLESLDDEQTSKALKALRALFVNNDRTFVEQNYLPVALDHDVDARLNTFRLLFYKSESLRMSHEVDVVVPNKEGQDFSIKERTRSFFSASSMKRKGKDFYSFMDRTLNALTGFLGLGSASADPGKTFLGSSFKTNVTTESELTSDRPLNAVTRVEFVWTGWNKKTWQMNEIFEQVEALFEGTAQGPVIKRSILYGYEQLKSYDVRTSIIVYPSAVDRIRSVILEQNPMLALGIMRHMYGEKKWDSYCRRARDFFGERGPHLLRAGNKRVCAPVAARQLFSLRLRGLPKERKQLTSALNNMMGHLFLGFSPAKVLSVLGTRSFFATTRVTGFRESAPEGTLDYISNSVGVYDNDYGTGIFDMVAGQLNISPYELRAMMYTPSM